MTTLGRYKLGRYLGRGGMGEVYLAHARGPSGFEKRVAVKILPETHAADAERSRRLLWEALVACQLDHPNIVSVLDVGEDDDRPYLVMEYIRGHSLGAVLDYLVPRPERLPLASALLIARGVARALHYIHTLPATDGGPRGLIHGDVSPSNVLLGSDGRIKLADFGVASSMSERAPDELVGGKISYLPAEAFTGTPPQPSWDVYALGCTLYQMLAKEAPFPGDNFARHQRALREGAPSIADRCDVPKRLAEVIDRSIDREHRFSSAAEMLTALQLASPPADLEDHLRWISELYGRVGFIEHFGDLPSSGSIATRFAEVPRREVAITETTPTIGAGPLRFGMSPALGAELARTYGRELASYLGERMGRSVLTTVFADYSMLSDALLSGAVDFGWMPPLELRAVLRGGGGGLVELERSGHTHYQSAIFVRADSPFSDLTDLRGRSFAWVDRRSTSGYLAGRALLCLAFGEENPPIGTQHFHGSHRAACEAVIKGWADAGATYVSVDDAGVIASAGWNDVLDDPSVVRALAVSPEIPADTIAYRPGMPATDRNALRAILTTMAEDTQGRDLLARIFNAERFQDLTGRRVLAGTSA